MKILIATATAHELVSSTQIKNTGHDVAFCLTGVGMLNTAVALMQSIKKYKPQLIIQAGIAGAFSNKMELAEVYVIRKEYYGDLGVYENGQWKDVFDMGLEDADANLHTAKALCNVWLDKYNVTGLKKADAVSVNAISSDKKIINDILTTYNISLESMEGIALHKTALSMDIPFIQLRAVSNYVGERDKSKWKMKEAIINLNEQLLLLLHELNK